MYDIMPTKEVWRLRDAVGVSAQKGNGMSCLSGNSKKLATSNQIEFPTFGKGV